MSVQNVTAAGVGNTSSAYLNESLVQQNGGSAGGKILYRDFGPIGQNPNTASIIPTNYLTRLVQFLFGLIGQLLSFLGTGNQYPRFSNGGDAHIMSNQALGSTSTAGAMPGAPTDGSQGGWGKVLDAAVDIASTFFGGDSGASQKTESAPKTTGSGSSKGGSSSGFDWGGAFKSVLGWFGL